MIPAMYRVSIGLIQPVAEGIQTSYEQYRHHNHILWVAMSYLSSDKRLTAFCTHAHHTAILEAGLQKADRLDNNINNRCVIREVRFVRWKSYRKYSVECSSNPL